MVIYNKKPVHNAWFNDENSALQVTGISWKNNLVFVGFAFIFHVKIATGTIFLEKIT
jgi:hypothetical protein